METNNKRKTIAIDMDGVIADVESQLVKFYKDIYGITTSVDAIQGLSGAEAFPEDRIARKMVNAPGFFRNLDVMPGAVEAVAKLMETYEVYIVSAATEFPLSLYEKHEWLKEHFPYIDWRHLVLCGDKSIINTDYMIDDHTKNLDTFIGKPIMFHAHHNTLQSQYDRVHNWSEVLEYFEKEGQSEQAQNQASRKAIAG